MAFVAGLSDVDRQKLKDCLQNYSAANEDVEHVEKPSSRKLRLGKLPCMSARVVKITLEIFSTHAQNA